MTVLNPIFWRVRWVTTLHSLRAPDGFSEGKLEAAKPRGCSPRGFAAKGFLKENPEGTLTLPRNTVLALCPKDFQKLLRLPNP